MWISKGKLNTAFSSLENRNFRNYWLAMSISVVGTWMQNIGQSWLVFSITNSAFLLGLVSVLQFTPMMLFSLFAGALIDQLPKKRILVITQTTSLVLALLLAVLIWLHEVQYWHILIVAGILGLVNTLDMPTRQSFIIELAGREHLMNAIALNSSVFNAARIIGPAIAGVIMTYAGIAACFFANALSFVPIVLVLTQIQGGSQQKYGEHHGSILKDTKEGITYILKDRMLFGTLIIVGIVGIFAVNFSVLVPVLAKNVLGQEEQGFGLLMSLMGVGSLTGALLVASRSKQAPKRMTLLVSAAILSVLLIGIAFTPTFHLAGLILALCGVSNTVFFTTANSTMQYFAKDEFRGRVTSAYTLVFAGTAPLGSLFAGSLASTWGPGVGFAAGGVVVLLSLSLWILIRKPNRT